MNRAVVEEDQQIGNPNVITVDDRPSAEETDSVDSYLTERTAELDAEVLAGIRELDGAEGIRWAVYRVGEENETRNGFLAKIATSQMTSDYLRDKFGAGKYYVRGSYPSGKYAAHRKFEIAADAPRKAGSVNAPASESGFDVQRFILENEMREESRRKARRTEMLEMVTVIGPIVAPIVAAMIGRQGPDLTALVSALKPPDPMQQIAALKALMPETKPETSNMDTMLKLMDRLRDMFPSEGGTSWVDVAKELARAAGPTLGNVIEGAMQRATASQAGSFPSAPSTANGAPLTLPHPASAVSAGEVGQPSSTGDSRMLGMLALVPWLRTQLDICIQKASRGSDPGLIAERIIDDLPDGVQPGQLVQFIAREDWFQQLQRFDSRVASHGPWFRQMRDAILEQFNNTQPEPGPAKMTVSEVKPELENDRPSGELPKLGL